MAVISSPDPADTPDVVTEPAVVSDPVVPESHNTPAWQLATEPETPLTPEEQAFLDAAAISLGVTPPSTLVSEDEISEAGPLASDESDGEASGTGEQGASPSEPVASATSAEWWTASPDAQRAKAIADWASAVTPEQMTAIDVLLAGNHVLVPREQLANPYVAPTPPAAGTQTKQTPIAAAEDDDWLDPKTAAKIRELEARLGEVSATVNQVARVEADQQVAALQRQLQVDVDAASQEFAAAHSLDATTLNSVQRVAVSLGIIPSLIDPNGQYRLSNKDAFSRALETALYSDPALREKAVDSALKDRLDKERADHEARQTRKNRSGGVATTGVAPAANTTSRSSNPRDAFTEAVRLAMANNQ